MSSETEALGPSVRLVAMWGLTVVGTVALPEVGYQATSSWPAVSDALGGFPLWDCLAVASLVVATLALHRGARPWVLASSCAIGIVAYPLLSMSPTMPLTGWLGYLEVPQVGYTVPPLIAGLLMLTAGATQLSRVQKLTTDGMLILVVATAGLLWALLLTLGYAVWPYQTSDLAEYSWDVVHFATAIPLALALVVEAGFWIVSGLFARRRNH